MGHDMLSYFWVQNTFELFELFEPAKWVKSVVVNDVLLVFESRYHKQWLFLGPWWPTLSHLHSSSPPGPCGSSSRPWRMGKSPPVTQPWPSPLLSFLTCSMRSAQGKWKLLGRGGGNVTCLDCRLNSSAVFLILPQIAGEVDIWGRLHHQPRVLCGSWFVRHWTAASDILPSPPGLVTNSILFCWLLTIEDRCR